SRHAFLFLSFLARAHLHPFPTRRSSDLRLLILDEPTAGVDIEIRRSMWRFIKEINEAGTTVILTTHYLEEAENLCRNIAIIDHRSEEHTSELQSRFDLVCRLLLEKKKPH